jgi:large subunit ribosomal protein L22
MAETKKTTTAKKAPAKKAPAKKVEAVKEAEVKEEAVKVEEPTKEAKKAKKAEKEAPQKPVVTSARATAYDVRVTPRKARLVIDLIRGLGVNEALGVLANVNKAASPIVAKVVKSAASNAINNFGMDEESLYIAEIYANDGLRMKRYLPRAKGSASGLVKRTSHITVVVKQR